MDIKRSRMGRLRHRTNGKYILLAGRDSAIYYRNYCLHYGLKQPTVEQRTIINHIYANSKSHSGIG
jgi:hypothetical protein